MEIDVAAENVRQLRGDRVGDSRRIGRAKQGVADLGGLHDHLGFQRQGLLRGGKPAAFTICLALNHQRLVLAAVERENQALQFTVKTRPCRQVLARAELAKQALGSDVFLQKSDGRRIINAEALQQVHHRVAALHAFFVEKALAGVLHRGPGRQRELFRHLGAGHVVRSRG